MPTPFRRLFRLFHSRLLENDLATPDAGYQSTVYQIVALLLTPSLFVTVSFMPYFLPLATQGIEHPALWRLRLLRLFYPAFSFAAVGFILFFQWDKLFPDRRDFLILSTFPVHLRTILGAKLAALCSFVAILVGALNFFPNVLTPLFIALLPEVRASGYFRVAGAQVGATLGASLFAFFLVIGLQGLLITITAPALFRRISPWIQTVGMAAMTLSIFLYPVYGMLLPNAAHTQATWLWLFPPVWFSGSHDLVLPPHDSLFQSLAWHGWKALGLAFFLCIITWIFGFSRHYRRTLESDGFMEYRPRRTALVTLHSPPVENAIFSFTIAILARSAPHRMFLATYLSIGIAMGLLFAVVVRAGQAHLSDAGLRSLPFILMFFLLSGLRVAVQFPAELASNWLFRIAEHKWLPIAHAATRRCLFFKGLVPLALVYAPIEYATWGVQSALLHTGLQLISGSLLIEALFWRFDKIPFTCSYFPSRSNAAVLVLVYAYGFTTYSFQMGHLAARMEARPASSAFALLVATAAVAMLFRRAPQPGSVRFHGEVPEVQTLDLH